MELIIENFDEVKFKIKCKYCNCKIIPRLKDGHYYCIDCNSLLGFTGTSYLNIPEGFDCFHWCADPETDKYNAIQSHLTGKIYPKKVLKNV